MIALSPTVLRTWLYVTSTVQVQYNPRTSTYVSTDGLFDDLQFDRWREVGYQKIIPEDYTVINI